MIHSFNDSLIPNVITAGGLMKGWPLEGYEWLMWRTLVWVSRQTLPKNNPKGKAVAMWAVSG